MQTADQQEEFSHAYVHAVATVAGFGVTRAPRVVDNNGIDLTIAAVGDRLQPRKPRLDVQLKCTYEATDMKASIQDIAALRALGTGELSAYLRSKGWSETEVVEDRAAYWHKRTETGEEFEALVPQRHSLGDYTVRMAQLLQTLSVVETRSELEIYSDIQSTQVDTVRLRFHSSVYESGSVPLVDAVRMIEGTREIALAAACATVAPRAVYARRKPQEALDYLEKVRLGQTERGSFVLSLHSAVPPRLRPVEPRQLDLELEDLSPDDAERDEPFERRVTLTLARSLHAVLGASLRAQSRGDFAPFEEAVEQGVSANLCDALADLGLETPIQSLEFGFHWSPMRSLLYPAPGSVTFNFDQFAVLRDAARQFRQSKPIEEYEVCGYVVLLERQEGEQEGQITLLDYSEKRPRRVRITLGDSDYLKALRANGDGLLVQCTGELVKGERFDTLKHPHSFSLIK